MIYDRVQLVNSSSTYLERQPDLLVDVGPPRSQVGVRVVHVQEGRSGCHNRIRVEQLFEVANAPAKQVSWRYMRPKMFRVRSSDKPTRGCNNTLSFGKYNNPRLSTASALRQTPQHINKGHAQVSAMAATPRRSRTPWVRKQAVEECSVPI